MRVFVKRHARKGKKFLPGEWELLDMTEKGYQELINPKKYFKGIVYVSVDADYYHELMDHASFDLLKEIGFDKQP